MCRDVCLCKRSSSFIAVAFLVAKGLFSSSEAASSYGQAYISSGTSTCLSPENSRKYSPDAIAKIERTPNLDSALRPE